MCFYAEFEFVNQLLLLINQYGSLHNDQYNSFQLHFKFNNYYDGIHDLDILELH